MRTLSIFLFMCCMTMSFSASAQYMRMAQRGVSPAYSNPTLIGWHGGIGLYNQYRNQTPGIPNTTVGYHIAVDGYWKKLKSAFAVVANHTRTNNSLVNQNEIALQWAPRIKLGERAFLTPTLSLNYMQIALNWSQLTFRSFGPTRTGVPFYDDLIRSGDDLPITNAVNELFFSTGAAFIRDGLVISAFSRYINQPNAAFFENQEIRIPRTYEFQGMYRIGIGESWSITPVAQYFRQGDFDHISAAVNASYKFINVGAGYGLENSFMASLGVDIKQRVRITYSMDRSYSPSYNVPINSHEIGIRTLLRKKQPDSRLIKDVPVL